MAKVSYRKKPSKMEYMLRLLSQKNSKLEVGIFEEEEARKAYYNEFKDVAGIYDGNYESGIKRPFITPVMARERNFVTDYLESYFVSLNFDNTEIILGDIGEYLVKKIKEEIEFGDHHDNADATIDRKGDNLPLIETGAMMAAVDFKVTSKSNPGIKKSK